MNFIVFNTSREYPLLHVDYPMPSHETNYDEIEVPTEYDIDSSRDIQYFCISGNKAVYDTVQSLSRAKELAIKEIRKKSVELQEPLDIKITSLEKTLKLDRSNSESIEKYYQTLQRQQQIRDSSNAMQDRVNLSTTVKDVWNIVDSYDSFCCHKPEIAPEVTRAAFLNRLALSMNEKVDPVFQLLTTDLISVGYIDLRQVQSKLNPLVLYGKLSQDRVNFICSSPVTWSERPIHGV